MKSTDFADWLGRYLTACLPSVRGVSPRTADSYRDAFLLYLEYLESEIKVSARKVTLKDFTQTNVEGFLDWIETRKGCCVATRNLRLAALKGFSRYLLGELPEFMAESQRILAIPSKKKPEKEISYLKTEGVALLVKQVNRHGKNGLRDLLILMLLYTVGLRVSELTGIRMRDISLESPATLIVHGKGNKSRYVPLLKAVLKPLRQYLEEMKYDPNLHGDWPLFKNHLGGVFNRRGINYLIKKYADKARKVDEGLVPADLSPHKLRHTAAMELLAAGVSLVDIRDLLGHKSVTTTEIYAKADSRKRRESLEKAIRQVAPPEEPQWKNPDTKKWLRSLKGGVP